MQPDHITTTPPDDDGTQTTANDVQDILSDLFSMQADGTTGGTRTFSLSGISLHNLTRLLRAASGTSGPHPYFDGEDEDEDDDETGLLYDDDEWGFESRTQGRPTWFEEVTEPMKEGVELLYSGDFGRIGPKSRNQRNAANIARHILAKSSTVVPASHREELISGMVPNTNGTTIAEYASNIYTGQFSADSSFYYTCAQDFRLHIFDTSAPPQPMTPQRRYLTHSDDSMRTTMKVSRTIQGRPGRWTITDANLSPDNERMIYSSITPTVYMTSTRDDSPQQIAIPFTDSSQSRSRYGYDGLHGESFGIYSCRFSADGNEVIAGGNGKIFVYDLLANKRTVKISAHSDDINSCCWADTSSGNVLVSASDDTFLKVWDRRSLGASQKPSGVLVGHTEGITYVSAKGDGRYVISNGKDQALRLWDLRKMRSSQEFDSIKDKHYGIRGFDYRYSRYAKPRVKAHPKDCSVMTYRGHTVYRTLIRCHFSPAASTGSQYIYSGSADGKIHVWSLDGRIVQVLDRSRTLPITFDPSAPDVETTRGTRQAACVRDVSWHSQEPVLISAAWSSAEGGSHIARHEWKGLSKMAGSLEDWAQKQREEGNEVENKRRRRSTRLRELEQRRAAAQTMPGAFDDDDDDEGI
ncbi:WD40 repeat-like protein [Macrolepiota fuliginosa MF-IS2]|uniref:WD40 repeat-like protein n=1 Tax=Macrolepiota fuliginosa MF-IS2 TaxID=1400762 RepID=A0A9P5X5T5_9AGAR|nr:WD40 repeat-like protein [Macrolepiota fuliginosa MF-IS2]